MRENLLIFVVSDATLVRWIPNLPKLRFLQLWDGKALSDERISNLLRVHCPKLEALALYMWFVAAMHVRKV